MSAVFNAAHLKMKVHESKYTRVIHASTTVRRPCNNEPSQRKCTVCIELPGFHSWCVRSVALGFVVRQLGTGSKCRWTAHHRLAGSWEEAKAAAHWSPGPRSPASQLQPLPPAEPGWGQSNTGASGDMLGANDSTGIRLDTAKAHRKREKRGHYWQPVGKEGM